MTLTGLFLLLVLLQLKHLAADFMMQTPWMIAGKGRYGAAGGLVHASIHGALTAVALLIAGITASVALPLALAELVIHYHVDWTKEQVSVRVNWSPANKFYWWLFGADQAAHQLTYLGLCAWLAF